MLNEQETPQQEATTPEVLRHLSVLSLRPGDVLVIQSPHHLGEHEIREYKAALDRLMAGIGLPTGTTAVILGDGVQLGAIRMGERES
jgi:hypothetical protein